MTSILAHTVYVESNIPHDERLYIEHARLAVEYPHLGWRRSISFHTPGSHFTIWTVCADSEAELEARVEAEWEGLRETQPGPHGYEINDSANPVRV